MKDVIAIILAAGRGTRMVSDVPKVMHEILGKSIITRILDSVKEAGVKEIVTVVGYGSDLLKDHIKGTRIVVQKRLLGSGDAVNTAGKALDGYSGDILIVCGDTPLIRQETLRALVEKHKSSGASLTVLTAELDDPSGYGRILRLEDGRISKIVEQEKAELYEEVIKEVNVGTYCCKTRDLFEALAGITQDNKKKEFFLTDAVEILAKKGKKIDSLVLKDEDEMIGVNTRAHLAEATRILKDRIIKEVMDSGVTVEDPLSTVIYPGVKIGKDTIIYSNTVIESDVSVGDRCRIGPFARIRPGVDLGDDVEIGNFVELVRTRVGERTKVKHHTYLGDTVVGSDVNIGAGTITANYDGRSKNATVIEDGAFIGVGAVLIAPVKIGRKAMVGAGCVVPKNHNVPKGATVVGVPARLIRKTVKK